METVVFDESPVEIYIPISRAIEVRSEHPDKEEEKPKRIIEGIATTASVDLNSVEITPAALQAAEKDLLEFSTVLLNHDFRRPIGKVLESEFNPSDNTLRVKAFISETENEIWQKVKEGILNKFSISWMSMDFEKVFDDEGNFQKVIVHSMKILEVSLVSVPADPNARLTFWVERALKNRGLIDSDSVTRRDKVVPFKKTAAAPKSRPWNASAAVRRLRRWAGGPRKDMIDWDRYSQGFAYIRDEGNKFGDFVFPHHDVLGGRLVSVFRGVVAATVRLPNSNLSDNAKRMVARHLVSEYRVTHKEDPPESLLKLAGQS